MAHIAGTTGSPDFPLTASAFDATLEREFDAFYVKVDATGSSAVYATFLGGDGCDGTQALALDAAGTATIAVCTNSRNLITTPAAFQTAHASPPGVPSEDVFLARIDPNLPGATGLLFGTYLGGRHPDVPTAVAVFADGSTVVVGQTLSMNFPVTAGSFGGNLAGSSDAFVARVNATGTGLVYAGLLGGSADEVANDVAVDSTGAVYVVGATSSVDFPVTAGAFDVTANGGRDGFATKIRPSGALLRGSTYLGGTGDDEVLALALDVAKCAYITGTTASTDYPVTAGVQDPSANGGIDAFVSRVEFP